MCHADNKVTRWAHRSRRNQTRPRVSLAHVSEYERMRAAGGIAHGPEEAGPWYQWGPYLSERAWGTVREDYSADGDAWNYFPFDHAHARVFRWSEDGLAGLSDLLQDTCFAVALWNGKDRILKERLFGLASGQGNHGEDVKEYYWYRDATPSQAWLRWRYHYPQAEFPYDDLIQTNAQRDRTEREFELIDTGVFDDDRYWVVDVDYAKATPTDISIRITITNAGPDEATLDVLPSLWFRNTWGWGRGHPVPEIRLDSGALIATHWRSGTYHLDPGPLPDGSLPKPLLCNNETNQELLFGQESLTRFPKDGIDRHVRLGEDSVNPENRGTKSAWWYRLTVPAGETREIRLRLWKSPENKRNPEAFGKDFEELFTTRLAEADEYYSDLAPDNCPAEEFKAMRMAFAGGNMGLIFGGGELRQGFDESHQVPDGFIVHPTLSPGRHSGTLDAMLDNPESAGIRFVVVACCAGLRQVWRTGIKPLANLAILDPG